jgi:hypothetical protein
MAFVKKTWEARSGTGLDKFTVGDLGVKQITPAPDSITQQGTALSAANFNDLEDRIEAGFNDITTGSSVYLNGASAPTNPARFYAPTTYGANGKTLVAKGSGVAPEWWMLPLTGTESCYIKYCTSSGGTSTTSNYTGNWGSYIDNMIQNNQDATYYSYRKIGEGLNSSGVKKDVYILQMYWSASTDSWAAGFHSFPFSFNEIYAIWSNALGGWWKDYHAGRTRITSYSLTGVQTNENQAGIGTMVTVIGLHS